jgi:hypothetical protein
MNCQAMWRKLQVDVAMWRGSSLMPGMPVCVRVQYPAGAILHATLLLLNFWAIADLLDVCNDSTRWF